jgi:hypothetical protein
MKITARACLGKEVFFARFEPRAKWRFCCKLESMLVYMEQNAVSSTTNFSVRNSEHISFATEMESLMI